MKYKQFLFSIFLIFVTTQAIYSLSEKEKIDFLLKSIEDSKSTFIRNGSEHAAGDARKHLEFKLSKAGDRVKTVEDFISLIATKSYLSGEKYYMKLPDGTKIESAVWLREKLKALK